MGGCVGVCVCVCGGRGGVWVGVGVGVGGWACVFAQVRCRATGTPP